MQLKHRSAARELRISLGLDDHVARYLCRRFRRRCTITHHTIHQISRGPLPQPPLQKKQIQLCYQFLSINERRQLGYWRNHQRLCRVTWQIRSLHCWSAKSSTRLFFSHRCSCRFCFHFQTTDNFVHDFGIAQLINKNENLLPNLRKFRPPPLTHKSSRCSNSATPRWSPPRVNGTRKLAASPSAELRARSMK